MKTDIKDAAPAEREMQKILNEVYPHTEFSVLGRNSEDKYRIDISWSDGPSQNDVESATELHRIRYRGHINQASGYADQAGIQYEVHYICSPERMEAEDEGIPTNIGALIGEGVSGAIRDLLNGGGHIPGKILRREIRDRAVTSVDIPNGIVCIGEGAFHSCVKLESIIIPDSVTEIEGFAFYGCVNLRDIIIPDGVTAIGEKAFYGTAWYDSLPDGVVYAGKVAYDFKGAASGNISIMLCDGTTSVSRDIFSAVRNPANHMNITIPASVIHIWTPPSDGYREFWADHNGNVTFRCHENSCAHEYAEENGIRCEIINKLKED